MDKPDVKKEFYSEPIEIILNKNKQLLRISCGACGDTYDIIVEDDKSTDENSVRMLIQNKSIDINVQDVPPECFLQPVHLIV